MKVYLMKLEVLTTKDKKKYYKFLCYSTYGFTFDMFADEETAEYYDNLIEERGFVDVTDDVDLRYNKKTDKLEYYFKK